MAKLLLTGKQSERYAHVLHSLRVQALHVDDLRPHFVKKGERSFPAITLGLMAHLAHQMFPTYLVVKVGACLEEVISLALTRQSQHLNMKRIPFEEKKDALMKLHPSRHYGKLAKVWKLRNDTAHKLDFVPTWQDFYDVHEVVTQFVRSLRNKKPTGRAADIQKFIDLEIKLQEKRK